MAGSREKARLAILQALVVVNGIPAGKASQQVTRECAQKHGLTLQAHIPTDADGQQKNVEYLAWFV